MALPLLITKVQIPPTRRDLVPRSRLVQRLDEGLLPACRMVLISAPAGYGKTALLSAWVQQSKPDVCFAWLSLEAADDEPFRFWRYFLAALQVVHPNAFPEISRLLQTDEPVPPIVFLTILLNELANLPGPTGLVLDDFHFIQDETILNGLTFLLEHLPNQVHLVVATRADPALPLPRLRAKGQLVVMRVKDLRFNPNEIEAYLNGAQALGLAQHELSLLSSRTEGWAAALQMTALALREEYQEDQDDSLEPSTLRRAAFLESLGNSQTYLLDYLVAEILNRQPEEIQSFLLQTSLLEHLSAPLCAAVLDGPNDQAECQATLEYLVRANLFLIPLDSQHNWFRYHALFADLMQSRLKAAGQEQIIALHQRAATWYAANQSPVEAIHHALQAGDVDQAADLVEGNTYELLTRGHMAGLLNWLNLLPPELVQRRPWLRLESAWVLAFSGRLQEAEKIMAALVDCAVPQARLKSHLAALGAIIAMMSGDAERSRQFSLAVDESSLQSEPWVLCVHYWTQGYAARIRRTYAEAILHLTRASELAKSIDNLWAQTNALTDLANVYRLQGRLTAAQAAYEEALKLAGERAPGYLGRTYSCLANLAYDRDELEEARSLAEEGLRRSQNWQNPNHLVYARVVLGRILRALGLLAEAEPALDLAAEVAQREIVLPDLVALAEQERLRLLVAQGRPVEAAMLADEKQAGLVASEALPGSDLLWLGIAYVRLANGQPEMILDSLAPLEARFKAEGNLGSWIETRLLQAQALQAIGRRPEAAWTFAETRLPPGAPNFRRLFVELALESNQTTTLTAGQKEPLEEALIEPLSARELEVLRLLDTGLANNQIAESLFISLATTKTHLANLFRKLGVHNRTQALGRARQLNLL